ncbi:hypothetical protein TTHERM_00644770 (macronuclear) [Tetrahymena thermophila SB210]|uniref:Uncharacterized protein n=1 Tax=Tetrahymena thermophila (strain SB210) TaxID=312017 RepID=Q23EV4_TETTS|nr:hypothetical protein TTHERM_00644770 [Tetrahymena thermophila SB210]EAR95151.1 hypothetical protein TTHERM_00644770 [Tetrahymena thermophila SB210]|eukprot:XP_001015396.1 hypothetical protein TTHERM_00644770 [Tetrahymena thermophila SB210]
MKKKFYQSTSVKFESLVQFIKGDNNPEIPSSSIQLFLLQHQFKYYLLFKMNKQIKI